MIEEIEEGFIDTPWPNQPPLKNPLKVGWTSTRNMIRKGNIPIPLSEFDKHLSNKILATDKNIYFTKTSKMPRYKFKQYLVDNKLTSVHKTNRVERAETFIVNYTAIEKLYKFNYKSYYEIPISDLKTPPPRNSPKTTKKLSKPKFLYFETSRIEEDDSLRPFIATTYIKYPIVEFTEVSRWGNKDMWDVINMFDQKIFDKLSTHKFVFDETLLQEANKELVFDDKMYDNLSDMLSSNDESNHKIAKDIICNANVEKSKIYILLLLLRFWKIIPDKSEPNFKSLVGYFPKYVGIIRESYRMHGEENAWQGIINILLKDRNTLLDFEIELIRKLILLKLNEHVNRYVEYDWRTRSIDVEPKVNSLEIKDITI